MLVSAIFGTANPKPGGGHQPRTNSFMSLCDPEVAAYPSAPAPTSTSERFSFGAGICVFQEKGLPNANCYLLDLHLGNESSKKKAPIHTFEVPGCVKGPGMHKPLKKVLARIFRAVKGVWDLVVRPNYYQPELWLPTVIVLRIQG